MLRIKPMSWLSSQSNICYTRNPSLSEYTVMFFLVKAFMVCVCFQLNILRFILLRKILNLTHDSKFWFFYFSALNKEKKIYDKCNFYKVKVLKRFEKRGVYFFYPRKQWKENRVFLLIVSESLSSKN